MARRELCLIVIVLAMVAMAMLVAILISDNHPDPECSPNCSNLDEHKSSEIEVVEASLSDKHFWKNIADIVNHNVVQRIGFPVFDKIRWDEFDLVNKIGLQSQQVADASYIESGLATPEKQERLVPQISFLTLQFIPIFQIVRSNCQNVTIT
ncbi:unnamed protein product [Cuscuta campestris]|uniref:Uncharacterized protein n=1 Tax=Cuscuta campestris TaxID=132261 RepID=A0A484MNF5_9ASTE|nr:unnamed protein product [Cuscuta campestris]